MHLAVQQVFKELGYDRTIGTIEDSALINETLSDCWTGFAIGSEIKQQEEERLAIREIYNSLSQEEKGNLKQEFIRTVLKDDPSLYKRYKNDNKIRMLFYEFLRDKLGG